MSNTEVIKIGKREYKVLFPHLLREYQERELVALRKSIRLRGVEVAIVVDEDGGVIDGINRLRTAAELKLANVPTDVRVGLSDEQKLKLCYELNDARRHMSAADREEVKARVERINAMRSEGKSLREIAEVAGVSQVQVLKHLNESATSGQSADDRGETVNRLTVSPPTPDRVIGRDGVARPAKNDADTVAERDAAIAKGLAEGKPVSKVAAEVGVSDRTVQNAKKRLAENANDDTPTPEPSKPEVIRPSGETTQGGKITRDEMGIPIQEHARTAFDDRHLFDEVIKKAKELRELITVLVDKPAGGHLVKLVNWVRRPTKDNPEGGYWQLPDLENVMIKVNSCKPAVTDCPYAHNPHGPHPADCRCCHGLRWCATLKRKELLAEQIACMKAHYGVASDTHEESEE